MADLNAVLRLRPDVRDREVGEDDLILARDDEALAAHRDLPPAAVDGEVRRKDQRTGERDVAVEIEEDHARRIARVRPDAERARAVVGERGDVVDVVARLEAAERARAEALDGKGLSRKRDHGGIDAGLGLRGVGHRGVLVARRARRARVGCYRRRRPAIAAVGSILCRVRAAAATRHQEQHGRDPEASPRPAAP